MDRVSYGTTGYEGPGTSFNGYSSSTHYKVGNVNFSSGGLGAGSSTFFSLESNLSGATFTVPASFVVTKSASPSGVIAGDASTPITYTLTATNLGNAVGDVTISDGIPTGTTYVASSAACPTVTLPETCMAGESGGIVSYAIDDVPGGTTVAVTFQVTANAATRWAPSATPPSGAARAARLRPTMQHRQHREHGRPGQRPGHGGRRARHV